MPDFATIWQQLMELVTRVSQLDDTARAVVIGAVAFLGALWIGIVVWTGRDVVARSRNFFARFFAVLVVLCLHVFGLFLYLLVRPSHTIVEREELALEHDLLRQATHPDEEDVESCPACGVAVDATFRFCPECRTELRRPCPRCNALLDIEWKHCPQCGSSATAPAPAAKTSRPTAKPASKPMKKKRR